MLLSKYENFIIILQLNRYSISSVDRFLRRRKTNISVVNTYLVSYCLNRNVDISNGYLIKRVLIVINIANESRGKMNIP